MFLFKVLMLLMWRKKLLIDLCRDIIVQGRSFRTVRTLFFRGIIILRLGRTCGIKADCRNVYRKEGISSARRDSRNIPIWPIRIPLILTLILRRTSLLRIRCLWNWGVRRDRRSTPDWKKSRSFEYFLIKTSC
jgi:hypothetical protein